MSKPRGRVWYPPAQPPPREKLLDLAVLGHVAAQVVRRVVVDQVAHPDLMASRPQGRDEKRSDRAQPARY
ncbi:MAG: hypothetical protein ACPMAQ_10780, partial [Phycisphaerae bacterium]